MLLFIGFSVTLFADRSVEQEAAQEYFEVGKMYYAGENISRDYQKAFKSFKKAALMNITGAQYFLGHMYSHGYGTRKNLIQAQHWLSKAAEKGHSEAQLELGLLLSSGEKGINQNLKKSAELFEKAASEGNIRACFNLGFAYANGEGVKKDVSKAAALYTQAAQKGYVKAMFNLGLLYLSGNGVPKNPSKAAYWFEQAAKKDNPNAQFNLGAMYASGIGVKKDMSAAAQWIKKARDNGLKKAAQVWSSHKLWKY